MSASVAAIVLAAGASSRLGQPKQLLLHQGETLVARAIRLAFEAGSSPVVCVLGANHETIQATLQSSAATIVVNEQWQSGIASSIHAGLNTIMRDAPDVQGVLILTCDQPRLTAAHLQTMIERFNAQLTPSIIASSYADSVGIPVLFPRNAFSELLTLRGDKGARTLLIQPNRPLQTIHLPGGEIDIDQPSDLALLN